MFFLPRADNFLVLMILAANSKPVDFCTHLRTTEKAPLKRKNIDIIFRKLITVIHTILICFWHLEDRATWYILLTKTTRCTSFSNLFSGWKSTCFGQIICPSSGVRQCTPSNRYRSYWFCGMELYMFRTDVCPSSGVKYCTHSNRCMSYRFCSLLANKQSAKAHRISVSGRDSNQAPFEQNKKRCSLILLLKMWSVAYQFL